MVTASFRADELVVFHNPKKEKDPDDDIEAIWEARSGHVYKIIRFDARLSMYELALDGGPVPSFYCKAYCLSPAKSFIINEFYQ